MEPYSHEVEKFGYEEASKRKAERNKWIDRMASFKCFFCGSNKNQPYMSQYLEEIAWSLPKESVQEYFDNGVMSMQEIARIELSYQ